MKVSRRFRLVVMATACVLSVVLISGCACMYKIQSLDTPQAGVKVEGPSQKK